MSCYASTNYSPVTWANAFQSSVADLANGNVGFEYYIVWFKHSLFPKKMD